MLEIMAFPLTNPDVCEFKLSETLLSNSSFYCKKRDEALGSVLLESLFEVRGVKEILIKENTLTVHKSTPDSWKEFGPSVGKAIRGAFDSSKPLFSPEFLDNVKAPKPVTTPSGNGEILKTELGSRIHQILQEKINPGLASHGGFAELLGLEDGYAILKFGGGCQGCSQISVTVKSGVEQLLRESIPELKGVKDITDHESGENPYFK